MKTYNYEDAVALLQAAVDERGPDFDYYDEFLDEGICMYYVGGEPACLIGLALDMVGVINHDYIKKSSSNIIKARSLLDNLFHDDMAQFTEKATHFLQMAQAYQDMGKTWGFALTKAQSDIEDMYSTEEV